MNYGKLLSIFLITSFIAKSQSSEKKPWQYASVGMQYYRGSTIGNTFRRLKDSDPYAAEIYFQKQVNFSPTWNTTKRLPQWGIGLFLANSGSEKHIGKIASLYPYVKYPLFTFKSLQSDFRFAFGLAWAEKPYDQQTNPENLLVSQKINLHSNILWQNEFRLSPRHFINSAFSFFHISNAKTSIPNLGINIPAVSIGYRYAFHGETKKPILRTDTLNRKPFLKVFLSGGIKQMQVPDSSYYFVKAFSLEAGKQISHSSVISVGIIITNDRSVKTDPLVKNLRSIQTMQAAVYASYEYNFGRFSIPVQLGVFVYNSNANMVEAVGVRYKLNKNWIAQMLLKAHVYRADMMHLGIGYKFH